jgi:amidophosphoribosyltransferase
MLRGAGAAEVHLRISAPPTTNPCFYGIDTPTREELIASSHSNEEILSYIGCDSLGYLSHDGMMAAANPSASTPGEAPGSGFCSACFTGAYPVPVGAGDRPGAPAPTDAPLVPLRRLQNSAPK